MGVTVNGTLQSRLKIASDAGHLPIWCMLWHWWFSILKHLTGTGAIERAGHEPIWPWSAEGQEDPCPSHPSRPCHQMMFYGCGCEVFPLCSLSGCTETALHGLMAKKLLLPALQPRVCFAKLHASPKYHNRCMTQVCLIPGDIITQTIVYWGDLSMPGHCIVFSGTRNKCCARGSAPEHFPGSFGYWETIRVNVLGSAGHCPGCLSTPGSCSAMRFTQCVYDCQQQTW